MVLGIIMFLLFGLYLAYFYFNNTKEIINKYKV